MQEQILPPAASCECFWEAPCLECKMDSKVSEDWQNNLRAQLVRGEDGCGKPEDCRFSFQWDTSLEMQIWSFIKINSVYPLLSVFANNETRSKQSVALVCTTAQLTLYLGTTMRWAVGQLLLDNLNLGRSKSAAAMLIHHQAIHTHLHNPASPIQQNAKGATEKQWHHSPASHCHVSVILEWIHTVLVYRWSQHYRLSAEFVLLLSQYSLLCSLGAHLIHHLSSFTTPLLLAIILCSIACIF